MYSTLHYRHGGRVAFSINGHLGLFFVLKTIQNVCKQNTKKCLKSWHNIQYLKLVYNRRQYNDMIYRIENYFILTWYKCFLNKLCRGILKFYTFFKWCQSTHFKTKLTYNNVYRSYLLHIVPNTNTYRKLYSFFKTNKDRRKGKGRDRIY